MAGLAPAIHVATCIASSNLTRRRAPSDASVARLLSLLATLPGPVFVHCKYGADRTGTIIACYRLRHDHWTSTAALQEANRYGMSGLERGMRRYVLDFAKSANAKTNQLPPKL